MFHSMLAAISATATITPSVSPSVTPTPSPTIEAVAHAMAPMVTHPSFVDTLNGLAANVSQPDIIVFAAALVVGLQTLFNRVPFFTHAIKWIQDARRIFLAVVLPFLMAAGTSLATGHNDLGLAPSVFLAGQVLYYVVRSLQKSGDALPAKTPSATSTLPRTANP